MTRRATVSAPANIALIKYWGARDPDRAVPCNGSLSMTLEVCRSVTTVEARPGVAENAGPGRDEVFIVDRGALVTPPPPFAERVRRHLDVIRRRTGRAESFRVATRNTFPSSAGLASSASGFAALACAVVRALGIDPFEPGGDLRPGELSVLARLSGSGSAARSVLGGYVQWPASEEAPDGPAEGIAPAEHWDLRDVIALVQSGPKEVSSLEGHRLAPTSPHFARRLELIPERLRAVRRAIEERDLGALGPWIERDAIELHAVAMTSEPPIYYWQPGTLEVLEAVRELRRDGVSAWSTMDAGANVHVICPPDAEAAVASRLASIPAVREVIRDRVGTGPRSEEEDLLEGAE